MSNALEQARTQPLRQVKSVKQLLLNDNARDQLAAVAAKHMSPERMMRVVASAIRTTPKLQQCDPMSFLGALMQCAALGLEPNDVRGLAYLIPFDKREKNPQTGKWEVVGTHVQLIVGYRGLIDLARRSGHITSISANIHYSDDELWVYEEGTEAVLRHRPGPREGRKLHSYAIAKFNDGGHAYVVLPWSHVMRIRDGSQGWQTAVRNGKTDEAPWKKYEDEMAKKTAIRALAKYLPLSVEMVDAMTVDEKAADFRAFAMNPTEGIAPVEDDFIEGETVETEPDLVEEKEPAKPAAQESRPSRAELQKQHRESMAKPKPKEDPKPEAKPQEPEQTHDHDPETGEVDQDDAGTKPTEPTPEAIDPYQNAYATTVLKDVTDLGWDEALSFHDDKLAKMKDSNPDLYTSIIAEARKLDSTVPDDA